MKSGRPRRKKLTVHPLLKKIHRVRISQNISHKDLEEMTGYHHSSISDWERGQHLPSIASVVDMCNALDLEVVIMKGNERL